MIRSLLITGTMMTVAAYAQTLSGVQIEPAQAKAGETVKIVASFEPTEMSNCALRVHFGDGQVQKYTIRQVSDMPLVITRSYDKPGQYKVDIEPTTAGTTLKCLGKRTHAMLTVMAAPLPVAANTAPARTTVTATPTTPTLSTPVAIMQTTASPAAKAVLCPDGWMLTKPGQNVKTRAFSCSAKPGTKISEPRLSCPGDLTYFENSKKGLLGCRI